MLDIKPYLRSLSIDPHANVDPDAYPFTIAASSRLAPASHASPPASSSLPG